MKIKTQCQKTLLAISDFLELDGVDLGILADAASKEIMLWIHHFEKNYGDSTAVPLLRGARSALIETIGYISFGLGRAAINSIRTEIDLLLSFSYFCDHPSEWKALTSSGLGFKLRSEIYKHFMGLDKHFESNLKTIEKATGESLVNLYMTLSAHIHAQSPYTVPKVNGIQELVLEANAMESIVELQKRVSFALSNFFITIYHDSWIELPTEAVARVRAALAKPTASQLFP